MEHSLSQQETIHYTNLWCREKGIHSRDLDSHPQIDDVILLIKFREEFWQFMNSEERGVWAAYWGKCYTKKFSLKAKHLDKLENIAGSVEFKKQTQARRQATIKAMRQRLQTA